MAKWEREESGQRNSEKSYEFFPDGSHRGKGATLTSPHGVEGRPPAAGTVVPGPSVSQVGTVLTAQHPWLPPGRASVCLRVQNPQALVKMAC